MTETRSGGAAQHGRPVLPGDRDARRPGAGRGARARRRGRDVPHRPVRPQRPARRHVPAGDPRARGRGRGRGGRRRGDRRGARRPRGAHLRLLRRLRGLPARLPDDVRGVRAAQPRRPARGRRPAARATRRARRSPAAGSGSRRSRATRSPPPATSSGSPDDVPLELARPARLRRPDRRGRRPQRHAAVAGAVGRGVRHRRGRAVRRHGGRGWPARGEIVAVDLSNGAPRARAWSSARRGRSTAPTPTSPARSPRAVRAPTSASTPPGWSR